MARGASMSQSVSQPDQVVISASAKRKSGGGIQITVTARNAGPSVVTYEADSKGYLQQIELQVKRPSGSRRCKVRDDISHDGRLQELQPGKSFSVMLDSSQYDCENDLSTGSPFIVLWSSGFFGISPHRMLRSHPIKITGADE